MPRSIARTVHSGSIKRFCVNACAIVLAFDLDFNAFDILLLLRAVLFGFTLAVITRYGFNVKKKVYACMYMVKQRDGGRECILIQF